jgi:hypothetical protein
MIESLYGKYFQKSRSFLYPALGIKKSSSTHPTGTYLSLEGRIGPEDMKLICSYNNCETDGFKAFENKMLLTNPLFEQVIQVQDYKLYVFDYQTYKDDWFNFLLGKYSKLSTVLKRAIKVYYGENSSEYKYMDSYLYPEKYHSLYAKILDVDIKTIKSSGGELCDSCNIDKETLKIPIEHLVVLDK